MRGAEPGSGILVLALWYSSAEGVMRVVCGVRAQVSWGCCVLKFLVLTP